jgi:hypothetical protein
MAKRSGVVTIVRAAAEFTSALLQTPMPHEEELQRGFGYRASDWSEGRTRAFAALGQPLVRRDGWGRFRFPFSGSACEYVRNTIRDCQRLLFCAGVLDRRRDRQRALRFVTVPPREYVAAGLERTDPLVFAYYLVHPLAVAAAIVDLRLAALVPTYQPSSAGLPSQHCPRSNRESAL